MAGDSPCFQCLQRCVESEISADVIFRYGIADSPLPFGSSAVVQIFPNDGADNVESEEVSAQFLLVRLVDHDNSTCSSSKDSIYNDCGEEDISFPAEDQSEVNLGVLNDSVGPRSSDCSAEDPIDLQIGRNSYIKIIAALAPVACVKPASDETIKDLARKYLSDLTEDHVISSLNLFTQENFADQYSANFLSLIGFPSFSESNTPCSVRHPNIAPVLGIIKSSGCNYLLGCKIPYTLQNILHYSPEALKSDWHIRFLIYQLLSALTYMHSLGVAHGNICPSSILLNDSSWAWLSITDMFLVRGNLSLKEPVFSSTRAFCCMDGCPCHSIYADLHLSASIDWHSDFIHWWKGELSNYEYLLILNRLAGRRWGDHTFHIAMPWVIDFTVKPDENSDTGWRDLKKSKWRLAKGDEQLDFTFQTSEIPHHVSDECLSELAVCSYKARRLPLRILRSAVRSVYEPNEYPSNMQRLYQWTPDECIPEFYSDPQIFFSLHSEMSDLVVPSWAATPEEFISLHRDALESDRVSRQIHHWIDITFGYKLSGEASISAKNVMLPISDSSMPRSAGRMQLFTRPHPMRRGVTQRSHYNKTELNSSMRRDSNGSLQTSNGDILLPDAHYMEHLEEAISFCEHARYLCPVYNYHENFVKNFPCLKSSQVSKGEILESTGSNSIIPSDLFSGLLECFNVNDTTLAGFQELLRWRQKSSSSGISSEDLAGDIFSIGCILGELYLKRPLFDPVTFSAYRESGTLPGILQDLPPHVAIFVEASIQEDWKRRPSAKSLLESQFFPPTIRCAYLFLAPLQILAKAGHRIKYAAKLASVGALRAMGTYAAEMCAPFCLSLIMSPLSNVEAESALCILKEFLKCLNTQGIKTLILPSIQKILQASECSHLKVSLLQDSFVQELWTRVGKQAYLEKIQPLVIANLCNSPNRTSASVASVVLIGSCEELGIPITIHQTILPIIHSFGKGLSSDGVNVLVRIGGLLGEKFIIRQLLPLIRNIILSCIDASRLNKSEPHDSWISLALIDSFSTLDGLASILPVEVVLKELIREEICLYVKVLMLSHMDLAVTQIAATSLVAVCQKIGQDLTISHVMPQLKDLFEELAFSPDAAYGPSSSRRNLKVSKAKSDEAVQIESRLDLVLLLYPSFQSLIGMEKLRQCCSVWFLLEQILQRFYNWKWDSTRESSKTGGDNMNVQRFYFGKASSSEYNPAKLLLNGVGWSIPQSQGGKGGITSLNSKQVTEIQRSSSNKHATKSNLEHHEPWFWLPDAKCDGLDFLGRSGGLKDELPWKIKASILYSARAHPGALRSLAVYHDECTVYTGGVGPGFKGSVQKWELARMNCVSGYYGHDEVVNAISILSTSGRVASCDGNIHVWNGQTGKLIAAYAESSANLAHNGLPLAAKVTADQPNMLTPNVLSGGILSNAFSDSLYTCMHHLEYEEKLVAGMGNGSVRFIDVVHDQKLHLWKNNAAEYSFASLVSAICSCGSGKFQERAVTSPSYIAIGLSSGYCRLLDARSGNIISAWRAHDGYITKLAAPEDNLLVSSSLDKTLRVWDLRRNLGSQSNVFRGHQDGISSFSIWGQDVISVSRNKIALTSLSRCTNEGGQRQLSLQNLYTADKGTRNLSVISTIDVLPFSRLFLVGTEDGYLKICS
ncbi:protein GFS12 isoform X2 [Asparagus officinalis]|uniref:protein GFS12 isoform X2 n=1 Tax=Asparagus officinalis TaxID=4686 RepID=UPI00098E79F8|nr:protein GFS12 isoform X2 [Asparagus officinalis]